MTDLTAISDEELPGSPSVRGRPGARSWTPIALLKGAEHLAARATYMEEKATYERMKAEVAR